jgi:hypothetical protein
MKEPNLAAPWGENPVALEADGVDADSGMAWSVVVKGKAAAITGTEEILDSASLYLFPWQAGRKDHFVRITPDTITGRRFKVTPPLTCGRSSAALSGPRPRRGRRDHIAGSHRHVMPAR